MVEKEQDEDAQDVAATLQGDLDAFARLVRRWQRPLLSLAFRFCGDATHAEDLVQESFLRIYRALPHWRQESKFSTWLFSVATNVCRSDYRSSKGFLPLDEAADFIGTDTLDATLAAQSLSEQVQKAVSYLPPKYRDPLLLFYFHERNLAETASALRLSEGTVKTRLFRARNILRLKLQGICPER